MKKRIQLWKCIGLMMVFVIFSTAIFGCSQKPADDGSAAQENTEEETTEEAAKEETTEADKKYVVGVVWQDMSNEHNILLEKIAKAYSSYYYPEIEFQYVDGQGDVGTQVSQVEGFVVKGVDCIIIQPLDNDALSPAITAATEAGVDVVSTTELDDSTGSIWVGYDLLTSGKILGQGIVDMLDGKGNVAIIRGPIGHAGEVFRTEGANMVFEENPDINVVFDQPANWARDEAMRLMENWLQTDTKIDAVCAQNDEMALGAIAALKDAGKLDDVKVMGIDGIMDAFLSIKEGELDMTAYQDGKAFLEGCIDAAARACKGEDVEDIMIGYEVVTSENVDEWMEVLEFVENPDYAALEESKK